MIGKRELAARVLGASPVRSAILRVLGRPSLVCLTYHRIGRVDDLDSSIISASSQDFEWQARWLQHNLRILDGVELCAFVRGELSLEKPAACITFDDGYADNLQAGELLKRIGVPAVFFVTSSFIGSDRVSEWDRLAYAVKRTREVVLHIDAVDHHGPWAVPIGDKHRDDAVDEVKKLFRTVMPARQDDFVDAVERAAGVAVRERLRERPVWLSWDQVRALQKMGHTIGAHSHSHPILSSLPSSAQREELRRSKEVLERELGAPVALMAYPAGKPHTFTVETKRLAAEVGYQAAFSFYGGANFTGSIDPYDVRRVAVERDTTHALFRARASLASVYPL